MLFSIVTESMYITANSVQGFLHLYILTNACFLDPYSDPGEVVLICLSLISDIQHWNAPVSHFDVFFGKMSI